MDLTSLKLRIRNRLQPSSVSAALKSALAAIQILYFRALRRWNKPGFKSGLFRTVGWVLLATFYGLFVGAATVILPPMAPVALVALSAPVLFWALPDLPTIPAASLRRAFFITVVAELSVPTYFMAQIAGFPWISVRRIAVLALITLTLYSIAVSKNERRAISNFLSNNYWLSFCIIGYFIMAFISIFSSKEPAASATAFTDLLLNWYLLFFACLLVIRSEKDAIILCKTVALLSLLVAAVGVLDFFTQRNWALEIIPKALLSKMMEDNPSFAAMVNASPFRNGQYRASSIFNSPLSFGEFACIITPIGLHFILHAHKASERVLGILVFVGSILGIFVSGSRGGSAAFLVSVPILMGLWVVRYSLIHPRSMVGPLFAGVSGMGIAALFALILTWKKLHNIVFGGGDAASSDDARFEQWKLGWPHIYENPITGHGVGIGGEIVNWHAPGGGLSIDSFALNLVVETGVPGLIFYFGMVLISAGILIRIYLKDRDPDAEISAAVACSTIAYGIYRLVLSQRENQTIFFIFLALTFVIAQGSAERSARKNKDRAAHRSGALLAPNFLQSQ